MHDGAVGLGAGPVCDFVPVALINGALNKTEAVGGSVQASDFKNTPTYTLISQSYPADN